MHTCTQYTIHTALHHPRLLFIKIIASGGIKPILGEIIHYKQNHPVLLPRMTFNRIAPKDSPAALSRSNTTLIPTMLIASPGCP
jgi:hypothetical protein